MSAQGGFGEGQNPFQNIFGDLARLLGQNSGPLNWDVARQVTALIAGDGASEPNVDPVDRIRLEELTRIAQLHVDQATGTNVVVRDVVAMNHVEWALRSLEDYRTLLDELATAMSTPTENDADDPGTSPAGAAQMHDLEQFITPVLLGIQVGGMVGHLARRSFAQYDLPVPRATTDVAVYIPENIKSFAADWSMERDELTLWLAIEEVARLSVLQRAHVRDRFIELINQYMSGFRPDFNSIQEQLAQLDINDPSQLPAAFSDPSALLGAMQTPDQLQTLAQLNALVAAFVGYVDHIVATVAPRVIASAPVIAEATKRRRVEESEGARLVERLFGLELTQPQFDRGHAFISGVIERAGDDSLDRLWRSRRDLPTPNEVDAPGLWLARIDIPLDDD